MNAKTTVSILGTLGELHEEKIEYNLARLAGLVAEKDPDLLCIDMGRRDWEEHDLGQAPVEYREALLPLADKSDIVVVPIDDVGEVRLTAREGVPLGGLRNRLIAGLQSLLTLSQRWAGGPRAINSRVFGALCMTLCELTVLLAGREVRRMWQEKNRHLVHNILSTVQRDPGVRVLVAVDCRRKHMLEWDLRRSPDLQLVDYWKF